MGVYYASMLKSQDRQTDMFDKLNVHIVGPTRKIPCREENTVEKKKNRTYKSNNMIFVV